LAACSLFILLAILFIPYAGIQADEALFSAPLFPHVAKDLRLPLLPHHVPLMVMTYIGSLKTLLYWPIFRIFGANPWTLRVPVVLLGAITIFFFFQLARVSGGARAAAIGALLLATDPVFLLTDTFDWGPVALEHVFLVTGCWLLYRFGSQGKLWTLAAGLLSWGLALWNKAIFAWALSGIVVAGVLVFWPEIKRCLKPHIVVVAAIAFVGGALPLVLYNLTHRNVTVTENAHLDPRSVAGKWIQVQLAANGSSLFGYIAGDDWRPNPKSPESLHGRAATWIEAQINDRLGVHQSTGFYYIFGALLLAAPWWWRYRAARFSLVFMAVAWFLMALTHDAGTSAHHVVWRPLAWAAAIVMIAMNLLVLNQYMYQFERDGTGDIWTDALNPLSSSLDEYADRTFYLIDWGLSDNLNLLHEGRLNLHMETGPVNADPPTPEQLGEIRDMVRDPNGLILDHVREHEVFPDVGARLDRAARSFGYHREVVRSISDSNGRPMFEIVHFAPD
jgi:hypothetical protein